MPKPRISYFKINFLALLVIVASLSIIFEYAITLHLLSETNPFFFPFEKSESQTNNNIPCTSSVKCIESFQKPTSRSNIVIPELYFPSILPYALENEGPYYSQYGQDKFVDDLFSQKQNGFFVEAGGYNGEYLSNTLFLELHRNWSGLVVEANPLLFQQALHKNRKCFLLQAGLSTSNTSEEIPFMLAGPLGGFFQTYSKNHFDRAKREIEQKEQWTKENIGSGDIVSIKSYPLIFVLEAIKQHTKQQSLIIDFFSLDTEGSELQILQSIDFSIVKIKVLVVEYNSESLRRKELVDYLGVHNFRVIKEDDVDIWFRNILIL